MPTIFNDNLSLSSTNTYTVGITCTMVPTVTFQAHVHIFSETDFPFDWASDPNREITRQMRVGQF